MEIYLFIYSDALGPIGLIRDVSGGGAHVQGTIQGGGMGIEGGGGQMQDISGTHSPTVTSIVIFEKKLKCARAYIFEKSKYTRAYSILF
jgi:hypothetical protein